VDINKGKKSLTWPGRTDKERGIRIPEFVGSIVARIYVIASDIENTRKEVWIGHLQDGKNHDYEVELEKQRCGTSRIPQPQHQKDRDRKDIADILSSQLISE